MDGQDEASLKQHELFTENDNENSKKKVAPKDNTTNKYNIGPIGV